MEKKYKLKILRIMSIYSLIMLALVIYALSISNNNNVYTLQTQESGIPVQTEYVYIKVEDSDSDNTDSEDTSAESEIKYTVREHMGKIGVFSDDGALVRSIDVYVKTLPEADRRLLREGIEIVGKEALDELIQDYDS